MAAKEYATGLNRTILKILSTANNVLSAGQINHELTNHKVYSNEDSVKVTLSQLLRKGLLYTQKSTCKDCKRKHNAFGLTEKGIYQVKSGKRHKNNV